MYFKCIYLFEMKIYFYIHFSLNFYLKLLFVPQRVQKHTLLILQQKKKIQKWNEKFISVNWSEL